MEQISEGDRVRVDLPDETDPDHERYHGTHGAVERILEDDADAVTGDERDSQLFRIRLETGETADFRRHDLRPPLE